MKARYQYRIYPTQRQAQKLAQLFGCCRVVWNDALARVKSTPSGEKWPSNSELQKQVITQAKKTPERHWLSDVSSVPFVKTGFSLKGNKLELAKLGRFKVKWSRPLPSTPSSVTITKNTAGQYHASFVVEIDSIDLEPIHRFPTQNNDPVNPRKPSGLPRRLECVRNGQEPEVS